MKVEVGDTFSRLRTLTVEEIAAFAAAAGDTNPLHHDEQFAKTTRFGGILASGTHSTALLLGLAASHFAERGPVVGLEFSVRFAYPVHADQCLVLRWTVVSAKKPRRGEGLIVDLKGTLLDALGRVCVDATGKVLVG